MALDSRDIRYWHIEGQSKLLVGGGSGAFHGSQGFVVGRLFLRYLPSGCRKPLRAGWIGSDAGARLGKWMVSGHLRGRQ